MSEVMRWKLKGFLPGVEGMSKAVMKPFVVLASDYDALAAQRDEGLAREAELRLKVESKDRLIEQGFKTLDRVHCMWAKRLLDATGIPSQVLIPDEEFVKYFEELKGLKQRLAEAEKRIAHLEQGLKFYADGDHLLLADADAWDTCSGEPINFLHDDAGTASVEDGSIAKQCLASPGCADGEKAE